MVIAGHMTLYGYFETRFWVSDSPLQTRFLLIGDSPAPSASVPMRTTAVQSSLKGANANRKVSTQTRYELTAFGYCGREDVQDCVHMDAKVSQTMSSPAHGQGGMAHKSTRHSRLEKHMFRMRGTPVVVGVDWTPEVITTYVDGYATRRMRNSCWHTAMHVGFALEVTEGFSDDGGYKTWMMQHRGRDGCWDVDVDYVRAWYRFPSERKVPSPGMHVDIDPVRFE